MPYVSHSPSRPTDRALCSLPLQFDAVYKAWAQSSQNQNRGRSHRGRYGNDDGMGGARQFSGPGARGGGDAYNQGPMGNGHSDSGNSSAPASARWEVLRERRNDRSRRHSGGRDDGASSGGDGISGGDAGPGSSSLARLASGGGTRSGRWTRGLKVTDELARQCVSFTLTLPVFIGFAGTDHVPCICPLFVPQGSRGERTLQQR